MVGVTHPNQSVDVRQQTLESYVQAITVGEPVRLRYWDSRGLTIAQLRVLYILRQHDGITVSGLASRLNVTPATTTGLTDRLVREKLIHRTEDPTDRRLVRLHLTDDGSRIVGNLDPEGASYVRTVLDRLSPTDVALLTQALLAFIEASDGAAFTPGAPPAAAPRRRGRRRTTGAV
jgi:MarR family transcriptional regulator, organic hydroperoxide resistance regulator